MFFSGVLGGRSLSSLKVHYNDSGVNRGRHVAELWARTCEGKKLGRIYIYKSDKKAQLHNLCKISSLLSKPNSTPAVSAFYLLT